MLACLPLARSLAVWIAAFILKADFIISPDGHTSAGPHNGFLPPSRLDAWLGRNGASFGVLSVYRKLTGCVLSDRFDLVSCSRPETRLNFLAMSLIDPDTTGGFALYGGRLFACTVGADVDFDFRRRIAGDLTYILEDPRAGADRRAIAAMWLGMVFLSDPGEFGHLRIAARDGMLACANPPHALFGDQWLRTLDCLLAYDPPESWPDLAAGFARNPNLLSRAVRERVRGTLANLDAIRVETERRVDAGDWQAAAVLWAETGRYLQAWPHDPQRADTETWRRETLSRWLENGQFGQPETTPWHGQTLIDKLPEDVMIQPDSAAIDAAYRRALAYLEPLANGTADLDTPDGFDRTHQRVARSDALLKFLTVDQLRKVVPIAAKLWASHDPNYVRNKNQDEFRWCQTCRRLISDYGAHLDEPGRQAAARAFREHREQTGSTGIASTIKGGVRKRDTLNETNGAWNTPDSIRAAITLAFEKDAKAITQLVNNAEPCPPDIATLESAWQTLTRFSAKGPVESRAIAFGGLFRLASAVPADRRAGMRASFLTFIRSNMIAYDDWPGWMLESVVTPASARGGYGIPWEHDALSAAMSWWSEIGEETHPLRQPDAASAATGAFSYITQAYLDFEAFSGIRGKPGLDGFIRAKSWVRKPPSKPFPPTAWQHARSLHLARPDLGFSDRELYRPKTDITIAW